MSSLERRCVAPTLTLTLAGDGGLIATTTAARMAMGLDGLVVLSGFAQPASLDDAYAVAAGTFELARADFDAMVGELTRQGLLITPPTAATAEVSGLPEAVGALRDHGWVLGYRQAIERAAPGKVVVDLTGGIGALSVIAAKAGARKVYAVIAAGLVTAVREVLAANGVADRVELVVDRDELALPERGELLIHDLVAANPFANRALASIEKVRAQLLTPDAAMIPYRVELSFVGIDITNAEELTEDRFTDELARLCGIDLAPIAARLAALRTRRPMSGPAVLAPRHLITDERPFVSIDLRSPWRDQVPPSVPLDFTVVAHGRLAGVAGLIRVHLDDRIAIGNHPALPSSSIRHAWYGIPVKHAMYVQPKDRMALVARVERGADIIVELA